jgi:hypothetical protein
MPPLAVPSLVICEPDPSIAISDAQKIKPKMARSQPTLQAEHMRLQSAYSLAIAGTNETALWNKTVDNKIEYVRYLKTAVLMLSWKVTDLNQSEMDKEVSSLGILSMLTSR